MRKIDIIPYHPSLKGDESLIVVGDDNISPDENIIHHTMINNEQTMENDLLADELLLWFISSVFDGVTTIMVKGDNNDLVDGVITALLCIINGSDIKCTNEVCRTIRLSYFCREKQYPLVFK